MRDRLFPAFLLIFPIAIWGQTTEALRPAYRQEAVSFSNLADSVELRGGLSWPADGGTYPIVLLSGGFDLPDRDGAFRGRRFFAFLADHLTRSGLAVLRYDKRGVGESTGSFHLADAEDHSRDLAAAMAFVARHPAIDRERIGILSHAEGGTPAIMHPEARFLVLLSMHGVSGVDVEKRRLELSLEGSPDSAGYLAATLAILDAALEAAATDAPAEREEMILAAIQAAYDTLPAEVQQARRIHALSKLQMAGYLSTPRMRFYLTYNPYDALRRVDCPVLVLAGSRDVRVDPPQNLPRIRRALSRGDNLQSTLIELPGLDHFLRPAESDPEAEEPMAVPIDPGALRIITEWIRQQVGRR